MILDDGARRMLGCWSLALCLLSAALLPLAARSSIEPAGIGAGGTLTLLTHRVPYPVTALHISHDPFEPAATAPTQSIAVTTIVRGVALGERPQAVVEVNGAVRVIGIGSRLAGSSVVEIGDAGVSLADGTVLRLTDDVKR